MNVSDRKMMAIKMFSELGLRGNREKKLKVIEKYLDAASAKGLEQVREQMDKQIRHVSTRHAYTF